MQGWLLPVFQTGGVKPRFLQRFRGPGGALVLLTLVVAMLFWNWKLLLATTVGMLVMVVVYWMHEWDWQVPWSDLRRFLNGSSWQFTLAAGSGGVATLSTYMAASIWMDSDSPWIATGAILQGLGTLVILIMLVWQIVSWQASQKEAQLDQLLTDLTDADPLKRLIAVRQLTRLVTRSQFDSSHHSSVAECLRLLLSQEQETAIRDAVLDSLQALNKVKQLSSGTGLPTAVALKHSAAKASQKLKS